ncbi:hypothetical protein CTEN210_04661 [Chaetoceros tenuissimus]|uniref:RING-type domain-containing protein n=1 Tax=Chaetoceros tenuissimus TaxID=426638 RepID=A0AAD3H2Q2_9STRA|nr:hypothetical protein CTEN210_04661 [Chaetoceros tenuissimus]
MEERKRDKVRNDFLAMRNHLSSSYSTDVSHNSRITSNVSLMKSFLEQRDEITSKIEKSSRHIEKLKENLLQQRNSLLRVQHEPHIHQQLILPSNATRGRHETNKPRMIMDRTGFFRLLNSKRNHRYTKDYIAMVDNYTKNLKYRPYNEEEEITCHSCNSPAKKISGKETKVVFNPNVKTISKVFFPCEHMCLCDDCYFQLDALQSCPACNQSIKYVSTYNDGRELDDYWNWIKEVKPPLDQDFKRNFLQLSHASISEAMSKSIEGMCFDDINICKDEEDNEFEVGNETESRICVIS